MRETLQITDACEMNLTHKESLQSAKELLQKNGYFVERVLLYVNKNIAWAHVGKQ